MLSLLEFWDWFPVSKRYIIKISFIGVEAISFFFISWRLITLQYCDGFCHTLTRISHGFTCVPHPDPPSHLPEAISWFLGWSGGCFLSHDETLCFRKKDGRDCQDCHVILSLQFWKSILWLEWWQIKGKKNWSNGHWPWWFINNTIIPLKRRKVASYFAPHLHYVKKLVSWASNLVYWLCRLVIVFVFRRTKGLWSYNDLELGKSNWPSI